MEAFASAWNNWAIHKISENNPTVIPYIGSNDDQERELARWYKKVQGRHQRGTLSQQESEAYESLAGWTWGRNRDTEFGKKAQMWSKFVRTHGRVPGLSASASKEEQTLAKWGARVRRAKAKNTLPEQHFTALAHTHGWVWKDVKTSTTLNQRMKMWTEFYNQNGRIPEKGDGVLYQWRQRILNDYYNSKIKEDRMQMLSQLPGWTWGENDVVRFGRKWSAWVRLNKGTFPSPNSMTNPVEAELGTWAYNVRNAIMQAQIPPDVQSELMNLPFWKSFIESGVVAN